MVHYTAFCFSSYFRVVIKMSREMFLLVNISSNEESGVYFAVPRDFSKDLSQVFIITFDIYCRANDWEFFQIGKQYFLVVSNSVSNLSEIYR